ncbi:MAG: hypothetical protein EOM20_08185 [Spartobacteria bacterium]|nr:hypothetical protein [Spartobacteria bacterium]
MARNLFMNWLVAWGLLISIGNLWVLGDPAPGVNEPPVADAGADAVASVGRALSLNGVLTDDGYPNWTMSISWSKVSGPGTVTFKNRLKYVIVGGIGGPPVPPMVVNMNDSTATFSEIGTYVLRLSVSDTELSSYDEMTVTVVPAYGTGPLLSEDFAAGAMASLTSGLWGVENHGDGLAWALDATTGRVEAACAPGATQDAWLISPVVDCSGYSNVCLQLTEQFNGGNLDHWSYGYVLGSIDGGATWTAYSNELHAYGPGAPEEQTPEQEVTLDMSWADGQSEVRLAWGYYANEDGWWRINEVHVLGDLPGMITPNQLCIKPNPSAYTIEIPTQPGKVYTVEYTDDALSDTMTWHPFIDQSNGVGRYEETNTTWGTVSFEDTMGPATTGGEPVDGRRYYRVRVEDADP